MKVEIVSDNVAKITFWRCRHCVRNYSSEASAAICAEFDEKRKDVIGDDEITDAFYITELPR